MAKVVGLGNCQTNGMARAAAAMLSAELETVLPRRAHRDPALLSKALEGASIVFANREMSWTRAQECAAAIGRADLPVIPTPSIYFSGFHPDVVFPSEASGDRQDLPMINANSAILLAAFREGLGLDAATSLFRDEVYDALGYYHAFTLATEALVEECAFAGCDVRPLLEGWRAQGAFVYVPNHPRVQVLQDLALMQLRNHAVHDGILRSDFKMDDPLAQHLIWPVYPEIAERLGVGGDYIFRPKRRPGMTLADSAPMDLVTFIERTYASYRRRAPDFSLFVRMNDPRLDNIRRFVAEPNRGTANFYKQLSASHWWSKSVAGPVPGDVDPVAETKFTIGKSDKVATAGSCFAQHISKRLANSGFNYFVAEQAPKGSNDPAALDYGVFSARFGNIYTVRQLRQLAQRAFGQLQPKVDAWAVQGGYVDPFRPRIGGSPFATVEELRESRKTHLAAVREMFGSADVFVFTLGLTEAWVSRDDETVVPLAPDVVGAAAEVESYVPKNFSVIETISDLRAVVKLFQRYNPRVRILLTVSPVPLIATFGPRHVLDATVYSKSVLRTAAGEVASSNAHVEYFPAYEIITGSFNRGRYFADDLRQVTDEGVDHVMKVFMRHYGRVHTASTTAGTAADAQRFRAETKAGMDIVCDEEEIESSVAR